MTKVSPAGRAAIMQREGCRLKAYRDTVGVWTIGVGHTGRMAGPKVTPGMVVSTAKAEALLAADLAPVEAAINGNVKAIIGQNQFDALASLAFNIGVNGFAGSTVVHKLNAGDMHGAADAFLMWEKPAALKARREAERKQFLTPDAAVKAGMAVAPAPTLISAPTIVPPKINATPAMPAYDAGLPTFGAGLPTFGASAPCARPDCPLRVKAA